MRRKAEKAENQGLFAVLKSQPLFLSLRRHAKARKDPGRAVRRKVNLSPDQANYKFVRPLRKIFLQKKFEDPKMVGEFFSLPFDKVK